MDEVLWNFAKIKDGFKVIADAVRFTTVLRLQYQNDS